MKLGARFYINFRKLVAANSAYIKNLKTFPKRKKGEWGMLVACCEGTPFYQQIAESTKDKFRLKQQQYAFSLYVKGISKNGEFWPGRQNVSFYLYLFVSYIQLNLLNTIFRSGNKLNFPLSERKMSQDIPSYFNSLLV